MAVMTGAVPVRSYLDGPRITVDTFLKDPLKIQALVFAMADQMFLVDSMLRSAGPINSGSAMFHSSTPFYADSDSVKRAEFAEVHVGQTSMGAPKVTFVEERALAILVSDEMRRRMNVDPVNTQLMQVRNTLVKNWDDAFVAAVLAHPEINKIPATSTSDWSEDAPTVANSIRKDIIAAMKMIATAKAPGQNTSFGFKANTMIVGEGNQFNIVRQDDFNKPYEGNMSSESLLFKGKLPSKILGLDVVVSRQLADDRVIILERNVAGFIADELPLQTSALYRDEPRKTWRADVQRASAIGIDQPLAMCVLELDLAA